MPNNSANVVAGKPNATGGVLLGPLATVAPTSASAALAAGFVAAGYVGDDGLTETNDRSTDKIKAWGGDTVKVVQTDSSLTYKFTFIELNSTVLAAVYGTANVTTTAATATTGTLQAIKVDLGVLPQQSFVFEIKDGQNRIRIYVPKGQITDVGDVVYSDGEAIGFELTVEAFKDASGYAAYKYLDNGTSSTGAAL